MVIDTVPLAAPLPPDEIAIQLAFGFAVQLQPFSVETSTASRPPAAPMLSPLRLRAYRHGAPDWLNGTLCDPTLIAPLRGAGAGFAATLNAIDASP